MWLVATADSDVMLLTCFIMDHMLKISSGEKVRHAVELVYFVAPVPSNPDEHMIIHAKTLMQTLPRIEDSYKWIDFLAPLTVAPFPFKAPKTPKPPKPLNP